MYELSIYLMFVTYLCRYVARL